MDQFETRIDINAPIDHVYAYLADFTRHGEWSRSVTRLEQLTEGSIRVGTEFRASETIPGRFYSYTRVTALEPPHHLAWASTDRRVLKTEWVFDLSPTAHGTLLTQRARFEGLHLPGRLILRFMRQPNIANENRASLERIKAILEKATGGLL